MSIVKSLSVGEGDMFYIKHGSDNFTIIDCCIDDDNREDIIQELQDQRADKNITRFISTHPDDDHIRGLEYLDDQLKILNFYCVENGATKDDDTEDFTRYCVLRDSDKAFYLFKGCSRKWMNEDNEERKNSGIHILWPIRDNQHFKDTLQQAADGESPNNISPVIEYTLQDGATILWMGDLESDFMDDIEDDLDLPKVDILFAPHHGRDSGKVPQGLLEDLSPHIIVIGEAPAEDLDYYNDYNAITQNSAGDVVFECDVGLVHIYVSSATYSVDFLSDHSRPNKFGCNYIGTLEV